MPSPYRTVLQPILLTLALVASVTIPAGAGQQRPLPEVDVVLAGRTATPLSALAADGQWLILYVGAPSSTASARLLDAMTQWQLDTALSRVLIVVADEKDPETVAAQWREKLPGARWAADPTGELAKGLKVRGAPTLIGASGTTVHWVLAGVLNDPTMLRDVVRSWTAAPQ